MDRQRPQRRVEEDDVEGEAHPEGMDAGAARDQQAGTGALAGQEGEAEQARSCPCRDRHLVAENPITPQLGEAGRQGRGFHGPPRGAAGRSLPSHCHEPPPTRKGANGRSMRAASRHGATMIGKIMSLFAGLASRWLQLMEKKTTRRGNYESGSDYVLEYGELRFAFNEEDFGQRVEQAAVKLGFVGQGLSRGELDDLLDLAVSGEISEPSSRLGEHINENWEDLVGPSNRSLVHWIRRLVFRGAWLDQRVKEGELDVVFDERTQTFGYVQPDRSSELIELSKEPSWRRIAYRR